MTNIQETPSNVPGRTSDLEALATNPQRIGQALLVLAALTAAIPITNLVLYGWESLEVFIWGCFLCVFLAGCGLVYLAPPSPRSTFSPANRLRILLLIVGAVIGFATTILGLFLMLKPSYREVLGGGLQSWYENKTVLVKCILPLVGGLVLMFLGLQLARTFERTQAGLRRLLYGYNAVFSSLLLLFILVLVNLLAYAPIRPFSYLKINHDFTSNKIYTLNAKSEQLLRDLKDPVQVYALLPQAGQLWDDVKMLLDNMHRINPIFTWSSLSPQRNPQEVIDLMRQYKLTEPDGLLLVYGRGDSETSEFIKTTDLMERKPRNFTEPEADDSFLFVGENAVIKTVDFLAGGKAKAKIYFSQGHGELDFKNPNFDRPDEGMGVLRDYLGKGNYDLRETTLDEENADWLKEADVLVIARPRKELPKAAIAAIRSYLKGTGGKRGKLLVMLDVVVNKDGMVQTGLEDLLAEYQVRVSNDRIISPRMRNPRQLEGVIDPHSRNPIALGFGKSEKTVAFRFEDARPLDRMESRPGVPPNISAEPLIIVDPDLDAVTEKNLDANPLAVASELRRNEAEWKKRLPKEPLKLAMTVSARSMASPNDPHAFMGGSQQPVMLVFGDATWIANRSMTVDNFNLFTSCLSWLRERPALPDIAPAKTREEFTVAIPEANRLRMLWMPCLLLSMCVVILGGAVWVVRRR
jgi:hypothetical protein